MQLKTRNTHAGTTPPPPTTSNPVTTQTHDAEFNEAVERVYQKYGPDLSAFYRDVKEALALNKCESTKSKK